MLPGNMGPMEGYDNVGAVGAVIAVPAGQCGHCSWCWQRGLVSLVAVFVALSLYIILLFKLQKTVISVLIYNIQYNILFHTHFLC